MACWSVHAADSLLFRHEPENLFWACNLACLWVGLGLATRRPALHAMGLLWLCMGVPIWLTDMATGGELIVTSAFTHVGGLVLGLLGVRELGMPRGSWWRAGLGVAALTVATRTLTPRALNVNIAFYVWPGWEKSFPYFPVYWAMIYCASLVVFAASERVCTALSPHPGPLPLNGGRGGTILDATLAALEMPPEGLRVWFGNLKGFCHRHGGERHYGEMLGLIERCEKALPEKGA